MEGNSRPGQGKRPEWLKGVTDFTLSGLHEGSTVPEPGTPEIQSNSKNKAFGLFGEPETGGPISQRAFGLISIIRRID